MTLHELESFYDGYTTYALEKRRVYLQAGRNEEDWEINPGEKMKLPTSVYNAGAPLQLAAIQTILVKRELDRERKKSHEG